MRFYLYLAGLSMIAVIQSQEVEAAISDSAGCPTNNDTFTFIGKPQKTQTHKSCGNKCERNYYCVSWTWNKNNKQCYQIREFYLNVMTPWITGKCRGNDEGSVTISAGCTINRDTFTYIGKPRKTRTSKRCRTKCEGNSFCVTWTYHKIKRQCYLIRQLDLEERTPWISGECRGNEEGGSSTPAESGSLLAIGPSSTEVIGTDCDFPFPEKKRQGHAAYTNDGKILSCNGWETKNCWEFILGNKTWVKHSEMLNHHSHGSTTNSVVLDSGFYIFGSHTAGPGTTETDFLPTGSNMWTRGPTSPYKLYDSCVAKLSSHQLVVSGGWDGGSRTKITMYDERARKWTPWDDFEWRHGHACIGMGGGEHMIVGGIGGGKSFGETLIFNSTGARRVVGSLNTPRQFHSIVSIGGDGGDILVLNGQEYDGNGGGWNKLFTAEIFDRETETWSYSNISTKHAIQQFPLVFVPEPIECPTITED